ncbi:U3 small nucleolar RNA-associated protein 12 [Strigomonas culicis]|uniref:U3 small nucleolar RNA-associated protein 12 n=1 Tax=Strigomonas culicis TaxID=28005 RepID=S9U2T1_9TRYP|nr:U3 small nucleolar RNA-associated protein 12 [Strigomonas culicis]|eukprot:EPY23079.1 U3 small nucleolar RNA-associated protein 12 [Strigomonas culicis]
MVGKSYLRYVRGPEGGIVVSAAALTMEALMLPPPSAAQQQPAAAPRTRGAAPPQQQHEVGCVFVPALEAVRVYTVRSGELLYSLTPAEAKLPLLVTSLRVIAATAAATARREDRSWYLLVGYNNGHVALFHKNSVNNYGQPVCLFYALGHKLETQVLSLCMNHDSLFSSPQRLAQATATTATSSSTAAHDGMLLLVSGGQDTDLTVWDVTAQEALCRLRGHRGGVVGLEFLPRPPTHRGGALVVSAAADGLVKVWDMQLRQCLQTLVATDSQVVSLCLDPQGKRLYCGLHENFIKVYATAAPAAADGAAPPEKKQKADGGEAAADDVFLHDHGQLDRRYHKAVTRFHFASDGRYLLACTSKTVEVFRVLTREESRRKAQRKARRRQAPTDGKRPRAGAEPPEGLEEEGEDHDDAGAVEAGGAGGWADAPAAVRTAADELQLLRTFFVAPGGAAAAKVRSACFLPQAAVRRRPHRGGAEEDADANTLHIAVTYNCNTMEVYSTSLTRVETGASSVQTLTDLKTKFTFSHAGHQSDIRHVQFVENDTMLLSMSREKLLLWAVALDGESASLLENHRTTSEFYDNKEANVYRPYFRGRLNVAASVPFAGLTAASDDDASAQRFALTSDAVAMAAPSMNLVAVAFSDGTLALVDVPSSLLLFCEPQCHQGGAKDIVLKPDESGFLSVGMDRRMVLWTVSLLKEGGGATKAAAKGEGAVAATGGAVALLPVQEVELTEVPLRVAYSADLRYVAVALQNHNIQLFFGDSLKPYLALFGHKLPASGLAFSDDGTLLASVGLDKSLRFWGTDFGDCHKAIHAHDDYVTSVVFLAGTHHVLTTSLDGAVKRWDGDDWAMIQSTRLHAHGVCTVAATHNQTCLATAGADRQVRLLLRTQDILFPQEEEERLAQEAVEEETARRAALQRMAEDGPPHAAGAPEVGVAGQQTAATAEGAERLMEALDLVSVELQKKINPDDHAPRHPLLLNKTEWEYLWLVIETIKPSLLRHTLLALTSVHTEALLSYLEKMFAAGAVLNIETAAKMVLTLVVPVAGAGAAGLAARYRGALRRPSRPLAPGQRPASGCGGTSPRGLDATAGRGAFNAAGLQLIIEQLETAERRLFFDRSKIQGHKKKYHSRMLN